MRRALIHEMALMRAGDWSEQTREYCPTSGLPIDHVIESLLQLGASLSELRDLERLSDWRVLKQIPTERRRELSFRKREDVFKKGDEKKCLDSITWKKLNKIKGLKPYIKYVYEISTNPKYITFNMIYFHAGDKYQFQKCRIYHQISKKRCQKPSN